MRKLTQEEFIENAKKVHNNKYDYSKVNYINSRTKICIICPEHGDFYQMPKNHLKGQGCPICGKEYAKEYNKETKSNILEEFIKKAKVIHGNKLDFSLITKYINNKQDIEVICNQCGRHFITKPNYILNGHGCKYCGNRKYYKGSELLKIFNEKFGEYEYPDLILDKEYWFKDYITIICEKHGAFKKQIKKHLLGYGCPKCSMEPVINNIRISKEEADKRIKDLCGDKFSYNIDEYKNTNTPFKFICNTCGKEFKRELNTILYNQDCPHCKKIELSKEKTKTTEEYVRQAKRLYGDLYDYTETEYSGSDKKVRIKCNQCGKYFEIEANSHLQGHGCPNHYRNKSKLEEEIANYIKSLTNNLVIENYRGNKDIKELDIYVPSLNFAVELDGLYWHNELNQPKNYHLNKTIACEKNNIHLFHIFEDEWLYKQDIVKSMLNNIFHKNEQNIMARKCIIKEVSSNEASIFLDNNHLQGKCGSSIKLGLYYNCELVSLMTFGKSRHFIGNGKHQWELLRFCNKLNTSVVGGASKLFKYFIDNYDPEEVISYADRRWSNGNLYDKLNFKEYNKSKPNYYYVIGDKRYYRFNFRKSILIEKYNCPKDMTEKDFCLSQKWYRIYDCGCLCYIWKKEK